MSEQVKRYCMGAFVNDAYESKQVVLAADYDALAQRCRELSINHGLLRDELLSEQQSTKSWREEVHAWKGRVADMTHMNGALMTERDDLRAEVERLRGLLKECRPAVVREVEKWTRAAAVIPVSADKESALLARINAALEAEECAPTTGSTPEA